MRPDGEFFLHLEKPYLEKFRVSDFSADLLRALGVITRATQRSVAMAIMSWALLSEKE